MTDTPSGDGASAAAAHDEGPQPAPQTGPVSKSDPTPEVGPVSKSDPTPEVGPVSKSDPTPEVDPVSKPAPYDPERGLRGIMSGILVMEAIALLLGLTVLSNGGRSAAAWELVAVTALALAHLAAPALVKRRIFLPVVLGLQALVIAGWLLNWAIGVIGVMFLLVWVGVIFTRREFRLRIAAGTIVAAPRPGGPPADAQTGQTDEENTP